MNILVTGCNSSIGQSIINFFSTNKTNYIYGLYSSNKPKIVKKNIKYIKYKISKNSKKLNINLDIIIHCASVVPSDKKSRKYTIDINYKYSKKLFENLIKEQPVKIIFLSSMSVYKKNKSIISEKQSLQINDSYAESKILFEKYLNELSIKNNSIKILILRLPGYVGKNSKNNFLSNIKFKIINNIQVVFNNHDSYFNNVIHENTLCLIMRKFILSEKRKFLILNPSSKNPMKLINIIKLMYKTKKIKNNYIIAKKTNDSFLIDSSLARNLDYPIKTTKEEILRFMN